MTRAFICAFALASIVAGCGGGAREAGPVPSGTASGPSTSTGQSSAATTTEPSPGISTNGSSDAVALCTDQTTAVKVSSQQGAAGTISTIWRVKNTSTKPCRSFGYPGMDFRTSSGWQNVHVHRGGFQNINQPPEQVVVLPGHSLFFLSYWNDVDTDAGPCQDFNRVKVTLPDNFVPARLVSSGCLNTGSVDVGPVMTSPPS